MMNKKIAGVLAILWWLAITWLSTRGGIPLPGFHLLQTDKLAHAAAYALFAFLLLLSWWPTSKLAYLFLYLIVVGYGAIMEWVQFRFFPNRFFELDDMIANGIGAAGSTLLFYLIAKRKKGEGV